MVDAKPSPSGNFCRRDRRRDRRPTDNRIRTSQNRALAGVLMLALCTPSTATAADPETSAGHFVLRDIAAKTGFAAALRGAMGHAAAWGDADANGRPDLFVGTFTDRLAEVYRAGGARGPVPNTLLLQSNPSLDPREPLRFVALRKPPLAHFGRATGAVFADFDGDGWLDLYVSNNGRSGSRNLLYHNKGLGAAGGFELVNDRVGAPVGRPETARSVVAFDFNGDRRLDLFVLAAVRHGPSLLFENLGNWRFRVSDALPDDIVGLGVVAGDVTGNGWPDLFVGGPNRLFVNMGHGRFREATELKLDWGFRAEDDAPSCGVDVGDFDLDGRLDLLIGSHTKRPWAEPVPLRLFRNLGSTPDRVRFVEVTEQVGLTPVPMRTPHVELRDFDNDGWPDIYASVVVYDGRSVHPLIFRNLRRTGSAPPRFEQTALKHCPGFPSPEDYRPGMRTGEFFQRLVRNRKLMYFAAAPSCDFDRDGRLDLAMISWFPEVPSLLLHNQTPSGRSLTVAVAAEGERTGPGPVDWRLGIGAVVRVYPSGTAGTADARLIASESIGSARGYTCGFEPLAHLGCGSHEEVDVVVDLPAGGGRLVARRVRTAREQQPIVVIRASEAERLPPGP